MISNYQNDDIVIVGARRSIVGKANGCLKEYSAAELGAAVLDVLLEEIEERSSLFKRQDISELITGLCVGSGIGQNLPRQLTSRVGINTIDSAYVINEMCGSGLEAVIHALQSIKLGEHELVVAGGVEALADPPALVNGRDFVTYKDVPLGELQDKLPRADVRDALWCRIYDVHTVVHAEYTTELWAKEKGLEQEGLKRWIDEYALMSNERAINAIANGDFNDEYAGVGDDVEVDEFPRVRNFDRIQRAHGTGYTPEGYFLTNYNSPPLASAAAFMVITTYETAHKMGLVPLGRITGYAKHGVEPAKFLLAPIGAVRKLLARTDTAIDDYDLFELNTAFGSQAVMNMRELEVDPYRLNIRGDALALGHPIGAAGARILTTLLYALRDRGGGRGMASICLGGGNGIALAVESLY